MFDFKQEISFDSYVFVAFNSLEVINILFSIECAIL